MVKKEITLKLFRGQSTMQMTVCQNGGSIRSSLRDRHAAPLFAGAIGAVEGMVLAHACAGVDVTTPAYVVGIETTLEALSGSLAGGGGLEA